MILFQVFIYFILFSILNCNKCGEGCIECVWTGYGWDCNECLPGYFLDEFFGYGQCKKQCVESFNETDCMICDVGDDRDKCIQCHENYILSKDKKSCVPDFLVCGETRYYNCKKCGNVSISENNSTSSCGECNYHFILENGVCEYDRNLTKYTFAQYFNKNLLKFINLIILLFL